jgi:hypothetical protein
VPQPAAKVSSESRVLTSKQFAHARGVSEGWVRRWTMERKMGYGLAQDGHREASRQLGTLREELP